MTFTISFTNCASVVVSQLGNQRVIKNSISTAVLEADACGVSESQGIIFFPFEA